MRWCEAYQLLETNRKVIYQFYVVEKFNLKETRDKLPFHIGVKTLSKFLREQGWLRSNSESKKVFYERGGQPWNKKIDEKRVIDLYVNKRYSTRDIAKILRVHQSAVWNCLNKKNLTRSSKDGLILKYSQGLKPWNKGKRTGIVPRSAFKKGNTPHNKGKKLPEWWKNKLRKPKNLTEESRKLRREIIKKYNAKMQERRREEIRAGNISMEVKNMEPYKREIIDFYNKGYDLRSIAEFYEVDPSVISNRLRKWGVKIRKPLFTAGTCIKTERGETVYSNGERVIANFLFRNGINYEYNKKIIKRSNQNYRFDFYLPDYDLYIEYLGLDSNVAYIKKMQEKEEFYRRHNLDLIEIHYGTPKEIKRTLKHVLVTLAGVQRHIADYSK